MELFECKICLYSTYRRQDMLRHEKSQKHKQKHYLNTSNNINNNLKNTDDDIINKKKVQKNAKNIACDAKNIALNAISNAILEENGCTLNNEKNALDNICTLKKINYVCECGKQFCHQPSLSRHKKTCNKQHEIAINVQQTLEIKELKNQVAEMNAKMEALLKCSSNILHSNNTINSNNNTTNKLYSDNVNTINNIDNKTINKINVIAYLNSNFDDVPPIKMLNSSDISKMLISNEKGDHSIEEWFSFQYGQNLLHKCLGVFIINEFTKTDPKKQQVWICDIPRLKFVIRKAIKNKTVWDTDTQGIYLTENIITPMLDEIKIMLQEYITLNKAKMSTVSFFQCEILNERSENASKAVFDINQKKLHRKILLYIAPHFKLDLHDDILEQTTDLNLVMN